MSDDAGERRAIGRPGAAALVLVALVPPLLVAWPLWALVGGQRGVVLAASSLWVTATVEQVAYHAARTVLLGDGDVGAALRRNTESIKRLSWAIALADISLVVTWLYVTGRLGA